MKKLIILIMTLICVLGLEGCGRFQREGVQYFFSANVIEVHEEYLLLEVSDAGNSNTSEETIFEVSTDVVTAAGCPEFVVDEYARVVMARDIEDDTTDRLKALAIYKMDENGEVLTVSEDMKSWNKD